MKQILIICLVTIATLYVPDSFPVADGPDYWMVYGVASNDVLNIRKVANAKSEKVGEIPSDGQCIKNIKCVGGLTLQEFTTLSNTEKEKITKQRPRWCYIEYNDVKGWVAARFLREGACSTGKKK